MRRLRFSIAEAEGGSRLDSFLAGRQEIASRAAAERLLRDGAVRVDGERRAKSHRLGAGSVVDVELPGPSPVLAPAPVSVTVVFSDEHLVVVDKPAGIAVHPGAGGDRVTLASQLVTLGAAGGSDPTRPGIVHRLDKDTSGLLLAARSEEAYGRLREMIRGREVERGYLALVRGRPRSRSGRIDAPIGRDRRDPRRRSLDTDEPREAVTHFDVLETMREHAFLSVTLETGRTHQIRVHLAAIGLPVSGDADYGARGDLGLERQFLHAARLRFRHPRTGVDLEFRSDLPAELRAALERARAE